MYRTGVVGLFIVVSCCRAKISVFSLLQYKLSEAELSSRTVWLSVWDWDRFGRNQFLGEVRLPLASLDLTDNTDHWHTLLDQVSHDLSHDLPHKNICIILKTFYPLRTVEPL